ncbi:MAG: DUF1343 domain-containing protein [Paludibacteraceae bacterium]|nr:DUF1343 domain-containing protein [Paludibacteraceae bacterium]
MKKMLLLAVCALMLAASVYGQALVKPGVEVLRDRGFDVLQGKRIGLVTNPTGVDRQLRSTVDILFDAPEVNLVALYGPEHGVRGNAHAGDAVSNEKDEKTGLPMYSLYGKTRKPSAEMLRDVDALVYDIQDNGCRSYTYISTLGMLMAACAEQDKELIVLDRPNPLGGNKIEGCLAEDGYISFVSQFKIPYIYGQTPGELALMLNAEAETPCQLTVVPMEGWTREMKWEDTGLEWVVASPHVQTGHTAYFYPMTGILGEFGFFNIGVGYTLPFELLGADWIDAQLFADSMNALNLPGLIFRPIYYKPFYSVFKDKQIQGVQIHLMDFDAACLTAVQFHMLEVLNRLYPEHRFFEECDPKRFRMFDLVCGTGFVREQFGKTYRWADIEAYWMKDVESYRERAAKYYLY